MRYRVDVYYSGYITREVEADNAEEAFDIASEDAAQFHNKDEAGFAAEILSTLDEWPEADIAEIIE